MVVVARPRVKSRRFMIRTRDACSWARGKEKEEVWKGNEKMKDMLMCVVAEGPAVAATDESKGDGRSA